MQEPLYAQLYKHVLMEIEQGRLRPGDRVPSEKELAAQFQVSRITSKKALEKLAQEGIILRARGRGSYVALRNEMDGEGASTQEAAFEPIEAQTAPPMVGFLIPDMSDTFGAHVLRTIERTLRMEGIRLLVARTEGSQANEEAAIDDFLRLGVKGLIVFPVHGEFYNEHLLRLVLQRFPVTLVDRYLRGIPVSSVCSDNRQAAEELTNHLIALGHRHIAFISPPASGTSSIEDRLVGVMAAMAGHGLPFSVDEHVINVYCTLPGAFSPLTENTAADEAIIARYLQTYPEITAIVACEYPLALLVQRVVKQNGGATPQDLSIVCFDSNYTSLDTPQMTHMKQDEEALGLQAVKLLLAQLAGQEVPLHVVTKCTLVAGVSTAPPRRQAAFVNDIPSAEK